MIRHSKVQIQDIETPYSIRYGIPYPLQNSNSNFKLWNPLQNSDPTAKFKSRISKPHTQSVTEFHIRYRIPIRTSNSEIRYGFTSSRHSRSHCHGIKDVTLRSVASPRVHLQYRLQTVFTNDKQPKQSRATPSRSWAHACIAPNTIGSYPKLFG